MGIGGEENGKENPSQSAFLKVEMLQESLLFSPFQGEKSDMDNPLNMAMHGASITLVHPSRYWRKA